MLELKDHATALNLIPRPSDIQILTGQARLSDIDTVYIQNSKSSQIADYLIDSWEGFGWKTLVAKPYLSPSKKNGIFIKTASSLEDDEYVCEIKDQQVWISASQSTGAFYGIQTLLQLASITGPGLPNIKIQDKPRCNYRGIHLDVSRHFRPPEDVKKLLDLMARYKMNRFHWHLVDDQGWRIQIDKYPLLTEVGSRRAATVTDHSLDRGASIETKPHGGYYSKQDIRDIVNYAQERQITVIPEIDLPGHSSALLAAYPDLACRVPDNQTDVKTHFGVFKHVLCNRPKVFDFLRDIFTELTDLFPGELIHIGGDEVKREHWSQCPECQSIQSQAQLNSVKELHGYFIQEVVRILADLGKKAICWDDTLEVENLNSDVVIMSWLGEKHAINALDRGHDLVMTQCNLYFDFYQSLSIDEPMSIHGHAPLKDVYNFDPLKLNDNILGAQANIWTEYIPSMEKLEYALLPRMLALSEILWTPKKYQSLSCFLQRLRAHTKLLKSQGLNVADSHYVPELSVNWQPDGNYQIAITPSEPHLELRYTDDGLIPTPDSKRHHSENTFNKPKVFHARYFDREEATLFGSARLHVYPHLALNRPVKFIGNQTAQSAVENLDVLTNGQPQQGQRFQHCQWALFQGLTEFELEIDLNQIVTISTLSLGFDGALGRSLYTPQTVTALLSNDGEHWSSIGNSSPETVCDRIELIQGAASARFVRIKINNNQTTFSHEAEMQITPPLYIDEIVIN